MCQDILTSLSMMRTVVFSYIFWKTFLRTGTNSFLNAWYNSPGRPPRPDSTPTPPNPLGRF